MKPLPLVALAVLSLVAFAALASPPPGVLSMAHGGMTAVGPGYTESWSKTCTTTATTIVPTGVAVVAFECEAPLAGETDGTQLVAIGRSTIADPASATRNSPVICGSGCHKTSRAINARQAYCRTDSDDVLLYCWAVAATTSQP